MARFCLYCGTELKENADVCLNCGRAVQKEDAPAASKTAPKAPVLVALAAAIQFLAVIFYIASIFAAWNDNDGYFWVGEDIYFGVVLQLVGLAVALGALVKAGFEAKAKVGPHHMIAVAAITFGVAFISLYLLWVGFNYQW